VHRLRTLQQRPCQTAECVPIGGVENRTRSAQDPSFSAQTMRDSTYTANEVRALSTLHARCSRSSEREVTPKDDEVFVRRQHTRAVPELLLERHAVEALRSAIEVLERDRVLLPQQAGNDWGGDDLPARVTAPPRAAPRGCASGADRPRPR
jgi:hypothetical protein